MKFWDRNVIPNLRIYIIIGICSALLGGGLGFGYALYANTHASSSEAVELNTKPGHVSAISLNIADFGDEYVKPGESRTLTCSMVNGSDTDSAYVFVEVEKNDDVWSISAPEGWVVVEDNVFAYGDQTMTPVECGETVAFTAGMTVAASGATYQNLTKEDFKVVVTAKAVNSSASREGVSDAYADYESGGNLDMIRALEE